MDRPRHHAFARGTWTHQTSDPRGRQDASAQPRHCEHFRANPRAFDNAIRGLAKATVQLEDVDTDDDGHAEEVALDPQAAAAGPQLAAPAAGGEADREDAPRQPATSDSEQKQKAFLHRHHGCCPLESLVELESPMEEDKTSAAASTRGKQFR